VGGRRGWVAHVVWASVVIGVVAIVLLAVAQTENPNPADQCEGIGWGCQLYGGDLAGFVAMFLVPIALVILLIGHFLILWRGDRDDSPKR